MQFRTKARAVDLLGKGQIADLPTAITELWKNGYDAYADNVSAELYLEGYKGLSKTFFVMSDDGKGMSRNDIFEKWLVLGTDSKSRISNVDIEGIETLWKKPRTKAGEKGIGRLSVAYLGSPMLMLSKKQGYPLEALYFDWRLLENYNLFLDDINIPVESIKDLVSFQEIFNTLKNSFLKNFIKEQNEDGGLVWEQEQQKLRNTIIQSTENLILPNFFEDELIHPLIDINNSHGTKFIIFEPEEQVLDLQLNNTDSNDFVVNSLVGFTNKFSTSPLEIHTNFFIHKEIGFDYDLLTSTGDFFSPYDFDLADILINGTFNGQGKFEGSIKLYNDEPIHLSYINPNHDKKEKNYGSFDIKLGYTMGREAESKLEGEIWRRMYDKVTKLGGLYIYRDGFRVLPYGRQENDFLEFEKRRLLHLTDYFFSHRRMFGYIAITKQSNHELKDKSSREGLIVNSYYKSFKDDLISFFIELAKLYFSTKPVFSIFTNQKDSLKKVSDTIKKDKERERIEKSNFSKKLKDYPEKFNQYQNAYKTLLVQLEEKVAETNLLYSDIEKILDEINNLDILYKDLIPKIPKRYSPTDTQIDRLHKYESQLINFNDSVKQNSVILMAKVQEKLEVRELIKEFEKANNRYKSNLFTTLNLAKETLDLKIKDINQEFSNRIKRSIEELESYKTNILPSINSKEDIINATSKIQEIYEFQKQQLNSTIIPLVEHINRLSFDIDEETLQGAYKEQYEQIKFQWEQTRETAQLGIAVEIIDHEFNVLYSRINQLIKRLDKNFDDFLFNTLKQSFTQLEDKYALLSPLYRISGVVPKNIIGEDIYNYLLNFFGTKFDESKITFEATASFKKLSIVIKEPVIHTVFINIVNNANYWLRNSSRKEIILDYFPETQEILIINSGEKISENRIEKVFDLFFSTRPNGRGIGLYLSKQSLGENYFEIRATNEAKYNRLNGACFIIKPVIT